MALAAWSNGARTLGRVLEVPIECSLLAQARQLALHAAWCPYGGRRLPAPCPEVAIHFVTLYDQTRRG